MLACPFYKAAKDKGIKPILGVVLDVEFRISNDRFDLEKSNAKLGLMHRFNPAGTNMELLSIFASLSCSHPWQQNCHQT